MKEAPIAQENTANPNAHEHTVVEILVCPGDSPLGRDAEVCACGAQRLVGQAGKPAGIWSEMRPAPYANPIGHIRQLTQEGRCFTIDNPEDYGGLTVGAQVAALRYSGETGAVVKVQGTVTAVDQARAKFSITGPQADQEACSGKERRYTWKGSQGSDADPAPVQGLHDGHQFNPVAADPVQGGDGEGIAAKQAGVQSGPPRAVAGRDGAGDSHVRNDVDRLHAGAGQGLDLGFGCMPARPSTAVREVRI